jgi:predicted RecB family nuclease
VIYLPEGSRLYSPRDLVAYLEGDFAAWCERMQIERGKVGGAGASELEWVSPDEDEELALVARMGEEHEKRYLISVRQREPGLVELTRESPTSATRDAIRSGAPVIYQAHLEVNDWHGYPDFLFRIDGSSELGGYRYNAWDTKLAHSAKPYFLIQLCAYAELLEKIQGTRPSEIVFVLGDGTERHFKTDDFYYYYLQLKDRFLGFQTDWVVSPHPDPGLDRGYGRWNSWAEKLLAQSDHLSRVASITRGQVGCLEEAGILSFTALATSTVGHVAHISDQVLQKLQTQARLQAESLKSPIPCWEPRPSIPDEPRRGLALLPPASPADVFFDMEGFPYVEGGLEYLWGAVTLSRCSGQALDTPVFHDWWAHDRTEERHALEGFIDWVWARWKQDPTLHIYHYASYEPGAVKRLMGKYATREDQVDDLLRHDVFVDLFTIVKQGLVIGTPSYSLKEIERLYLAKRHGDVVSASGSVIQYQKWLDQAESRRWAESPILTGIRDYNRVDCESTWQLRDWLLQRQRESGIAYQAETVGREQKPKSDDVRAAEELADRLLAQAERETDLAKQRITQLLGWLVEFHRREEKPMWWRMFDRHDQSAEELCDDLDCLGDLKRTATPPQKVDRSTGLEYEYDPDQDTKLHAGSKCFVSGTDLRCEIEALDQETGKVLLKVSPKKAFPSRLSLIPDEFVGAEGIKKAVFRYAQAWENGRVLSQAVDHLLHRKIPRISEHRGGALIDDTRKFLPQVCELVSRLDGTTLCIQGPPGTGKTFTAAAIIVELLKQGKRVGVTATSHKVILNLLKAVIEARGTGPGTIYKVGECEDHPLVESGAITRIESDEVVSALGVGPILVGGTAWVFSREELEGKFDYLFVDEAGQVCLANAVAVGLSAKNLILVGDQMQLAQPTQGSHPGDTGRSCLEYLLDGRATVPPERGIFLGISYRMHSSVCRFISDAIYEGRLTSYTSAELHRLPRGSALSLVSAETGIVWFPVCHAGCAQCSDEEAETIRDITRELLRRTVVGKDGKERRMTADDILYVAPFNAQVRRLTSLLGKVRVGSVDRFQGQEAPVVIVSLCASTLEEAPRGAAFLLSPNRLNVAISRAQALAIVVGSPELTRVRCKTVEEMKLVNLLCRIIHYAGQSQSLRGP